MAEEVDNEIRAVARKFENEILQQEAVPEEELWLEKLKMKYFN